jgi:integral membrane protein (TIGR01906 family)
MLFASLLTTKSYLMVSKGLYDSHDYITYDHEYAAERIMGYLNYRYDDLYFAEDESVTDGSYIMRDIEISHMVDVKNLYTTLRMVALGSLIIGLSLSSYIYRKDKKELYNTLKSMHWAPIMFIMIVGGYMIIDFNKAFTIFHQLFFSNDDWQLYSNDVLILLLPQNFWLVSGSIILLLFSATLGLIYFLNEKYLKNA